MAAILGPGGPSTATYFAAHGPGDLFWGDHLWHDRTYYVICPICCNQCIPCLMCFKVIMKIC